MQAKKKKSNAGAIYLLSIGLFLTLLGAGFFWLLWQSFGNARDTRKWTEVPCLVINSEVERRADVNIAPEYRWRVSYKYQYEGGDFISDLYKPIDEARGQKWGKSIEVVKRQIEEYPLNAKATCFVNPKRPEMAVLAHDTKAAGYSLWFPALFSIGGMGMSIGAVRELFKK